MGVHCDKRPNHLPDILPRSYSHIKRHQLNLKRKIHLDVYTTGQIIAGVTIISNNDSLLHIDSLMPQSALPLYVQIANHLRQKIQQGAYQVGDKLPSQKQLGLEFGVNRHTVRQAFDLLKDEGILRIDKGLGAFIADAPIRYPIGKRVRYNESLQTQGYSSEYQLLQQFSIPADEQTARSLAIQVGDPVAQVDFLGLADGRPLIVSTSYFPQRRFPDILERIQKIRSISAMMREFYDCDHVRLRTLISTRSVRPRDAKLLQVPLNQSILLVQAINVDQDGQVIEYTVTRFRGDGVELVFDYGA